LIPAVDANLRTRRILIIAGIGGLLISTELFAIRALNRSMDRFAEGMGSFFQSLGKGVDIVSAASKLARQSAPVAPVSGRFQWNWKDGQELNADQSLRHAKLTAPRKKVIADALAQQFRPMSSDFGIESDTELRKAALDTRIKLIDLNGDGVVEVVAQGMIGCGATGNCPFWILRKTKEGYELILDGEAQTFTIQRSASNGFRDIVLSRHGSYSSGDLAHYQFHKGVYEEMACFNYDWTALEGDKVRELKEPRITPTQCW
jgi:hypothetical protein